MMIGGETEIVKRLDPILATLAPGRENVARTPGREKLGGTPSKAICIAPNVPGISEDVHNGIEYGSCGYAEGLAFARTPTSASRNTRRMPRQRIA